MLRELGWVRLSVLSACLMFGCAEVEDSAAPEAETAISEVPETELDTALQGVVTVPTGLNAALFLQGLDAPTAMTFTPDGRLFIAEQAGKVRVAKNGVLLAQPLLSLSVRSEGERGLIGLTVDPAFSTNGFLYVHYTVGTGQPARNRISRFTVKGDAVVAGSEKMVFELDPLSSATNHNGGAIHFGPDGKLYVGVGDNANRQNAPLLTTVLGKLLRLNADGTPPSDNPFVSSTAGKNRAIWAIGLRNPFTFAFHPTSGRLFINDVGENTFEEINEGKAGANYGWPATEGPTTQPGFTSPLFSYRHGNTATTGCSIGGGTFYAPPTAQLGATFSGSYFFADLCSGWVRQLDLNARQVKAFARGFSQPVDVRVGPDGALYVLTRGDAAVHRISRPTTTPTATAPRIVTAPKSVTVNEGDDAVFSVTASGTAPLSFQWLRNGTALSGATLSTLTLPAVTPARSGETYSVRVSNAAGSVTSSAATLTVQPSTPVASGVSFSQDVLPVLTARCVGCHNNPSSVNGLVLTQAGAHASLTSASGSCTPGPRVIAGNPQQSLLWQKLAGTQTCGRAMPMGTAGLKTVAPAEFLLIEQWILDGAKND